MTNKKPKRRSFYYKNQIRSPYFILFFIVFFFRQKLNFDIFPLPESFSLKLIKYIEKFITLKISHKSTKIVIPKIVDKTRLKNVGKIYDKRELENAVIAIVGIENKNIKNKFFVISTLIFKCFLIIRKFKIELKIDEIPSPTNSELMPIYFGKSQIAKNIKIAPMT